MLRNYFKILLRGLRRNKISSVVSILGLSIGFASSLAMFDYALFELSYDKFHNSFDRIYRVVRSDQSIGKSWAVSFAYLNEDLRSNFPEVESAAVFWPTNGALQNPDNKIVFREDKLAFANEDFFTVFSFPLTKSLSLKGLERPNTVVLSASMAIKFFKTINCVGKSLTYVDKNFGEHLYEVIGVMHDMPVNSHFQFDAIFSINSLAFESRRVIDLPWGGFYNYIKLKPKVEGEIVGSKIERLLVKKDPASKEILALQPIKDIHLHSDLSNELSANNKASRVYFFIGLGLFILFIAYANYINLAIVLALGRAKEVGIRKALGSQRNQLMVQFISESILLHLFCFFLAYVLVILATPVIYEGLGFAFNSHLNEMSQNFIIAILLVIVGAAISGFYPSIILNSFQPFEIINGKGLVKNGSFDLKRGLIVFQYVISICLIGMTLVAHRQIEFMLNHDLGMEIDQVLVVRPPAIRGEDYSKNMEVFKAKLLSYPVVKSISISDALPGDTYNYGTQATKQGDTKSKAEYFIANVDAFYFTHYGVPIIAGRNFSEAINETDHAIINETALYQLGFNNATEAIEQSITQGSKLLKVIGVVRDYHHRSLQFARDPIIFTFSSRAAQFSVKLDTRIGIRGIRDFIEQAKVDYNTFFTQGEFEYYFLNEAFNRQYGKEFRMLKLLDIFTGIGIFLSSIGLFAFAMHMVKARSKEIAIRKILGASIVKISNLLLSEFIALIGLATIIGAPTVYFSMNTWLSSFANQMTWTIWVFILPIGCTILFTLASITFQIIRAAMQSPTKVLAE